MCRSFVFRLYIINTYSGYYYKIRKFETNSENMSKKLLGVTFLVGLAISLLGLNFMHNHSKTSNDFMTWLLPTSLGASLMMLSGLVTILRFVRVLHE